MSSLRRPHHDASSPAPERPRRGSTLAIAMTLALALSACSPGQDDEPGASAETSPGAVESQTSAPATEEDAETDSEDAAEPSPSAAEDSSAAEDEAEADTPSQAASESPDEAAETAAAPPVSFEIPAIGAGSELLHLGLLEDNTLDVPPGDPGSPASWYTGSPAPGEQGPAVLLGHVDDSQGQPGVFADLPNLVEGDEITVEQEDGSTATFEVTKAEQYGKNTFPTLEVYGNTEDEELRLITCDGYNQATGEYEDNYVVYATLAG